MYTFIIEFEIFLNVFVKLERISIRVQVGEMEDRGIGLGFDNATDDPHTFNFAYGIIMVSIDLILYVLLAVYLEKVFPSTFPVR